MKYRAVLAATACLLVACDQRMPTEPTPVPEPSFQVGQDQNKITIRRATQDSENILHVVVTVVCPEGNTANISVQVNQARPNGTSSGSGFAQDACRFGGRDVIVQVFGFGWDPGPAVVSAQMNSFGPVPGGVAADTKTVTIRTR